MLIRKATTEERHRWMEHPGVWVNLQSAEVMVAEDKGEVIGFLCAQKLWHVEHLVLLKGNKIKRSRAAVQLYKSVEQIIRSSDIRQMLSFTRRHSVKDWADRLGWTRCFKGAATFTKFF